MRKQNFDTFQAFGPSKGEMEPGEFDKAISNPDVLKFAEGEVEVVDLVPGSIKDEVPVLIGAAWANTLETYRPTLKTIAETRRTIGLNHPREGQDDYDTQQEELRKAATILDVIDKLKLEKVDVIAHSEGAINITYAAMMAPEKFRNIVYYAPAGFIGKDNPLSLGKRFSRTMERGKSMEVYPKTKREEEIAKTAQSEALKYLKANFPRGLHETLEIAKNDMAKYLKPLREKGIGISFMVPMDDPVFPLERIQKMVKAGDVDEFATLPGGHGGLSSQPEMNVPVALKMFEDMNKKRAEREDKEAAKELNLTDETKGV